MAASTAPTTQSQQYMDGYNKIAAGPNSIFLPKNPDGTNTLPEYQGGGNAGAIGSTETPAVNPLAQSMYNQQLQGASDYAAQMPQLSDTLYNNAASQARTGLTQTDRSTRNNYNARGLLNSGGERSDEASAKASTEANLAGTRSSINQGLLTNLQGMESNAFGSAAGLAQPGPNIAQPYLSGVQSNIFQQMTDASMQGQMYGQVAQGLGSIAGQGLAGAMYGQQQQPNYGQQYQQSPYNYAPSNYYGVTPNQYA